MLCTGLLTILIIFAINTVQCEEFKCDEGIHDSMCTIRNYIGDTNFQNFVLHSDYNASNIEILKFINSVLTVLPAQIFDYFTNLISLDLSHSKVEKIGNNIFLKARYLKNLNLSNNLLSELNDKQFFGAFNLDNIDLGANQIKIISGQPFKELNKLLNISLADNKLKTLPTDIFVKTNLNKVNLNDNEITNSSVINFKQNGSISLNNNNLESLNLDNTIGNVLMADNNMLRSNKVTTGSTQHFIKLSLKNNSLTSLDFIRNMTNLSHLDLSFNPLSFDPHTDYDIFSNLLNLKTLFLKSANLDVLDPMFFIGLPPNIEILDISSNKLEFDFDTLSLLDNLKQFYINDNYLSYQQLIKLKYLFPMLQLIDISENNYFCADLKELLSLLRQLNIQQMAANKTKLKPHIRGIGCKYHSSDKSATVTTQSSVIFQSSASVPQTNILATTNSDCDSNYFIILVLIIIFHILIDVGAVISLIWWYRTSRNVHRLFKTNASLDGQEMLPR